MRLLLVWLFLATAAQAQPKWVDSSHTILLPRSVSEPLLATNEFPLFWWNFLVLELKQNSFEQVDQFCQVLNSTAKDEIRKSGCGQDLGQFKEVLTDWAADASLRATAPTNATLQGAFQDALTKASLPGASTLLFLLRADPLQTYQDLQKRIDSRLQLTLEKRHGFFYDPESHRVVVPMQLAFPPIETKRTDTFLHEVESALANSPALKLAGTVGPHAPSLINEPQIMADVHRISWIGTLLLLAQIVAAVLLGRWRLLLLIPPVLFSTAVTSGLIVLIFGSIHGLTLAFGPGIVGLCMDHGLHSCLNLNWKGAWKANWYGLLTTVVALVTMLFSTIPFLVQLMAFSVIGLFLGFGVYWILHRRFPRVFSVRPVAFHPKPGPVKFAFTVLMIVSLGVGCWRLRPNFGMQQMDYHTDTAAELNKWFFLHLKTRSPLLNISEGDPLAHALREKNFAEKNGFQLENIAGFLPPLEIQRAHRATWSTLCSRPQDDKFFAPFWSAVCSRQANDLKGQPPAYLRDFKSGEKWVSLWMTHDANETALIKAEFPNAQSLPEIVERFQTLLERETAWMAPVAMLLAAVLLAVYYMNVYLVALSLIPFLVGLGTFALAAMLFHFEISFISLIAIVMIFGLSLDYGIFATNLFTGKAGPSAPGVWTSVALAALVTFLGFLPLVFSGHPVLLQLGQALVWGTAGTILGSVWGIPSVHYYLRGRKNAA